MLRYLLVILSLTSLGCSKIEYSQPLSEEAVIEDTVFTPATHGSGVGYDMTGKGGISVVSVDTYPVYAVVFRCQHGKFIVKDQDIWKNAVPGRKVKVNYREVYKVKDDGRHLVDYDFLSMEVQ